MQTPTVSRERQGISRNTQPRSHRAPRHRTRRIHHTTREYRKQSPRYDFHHTKNQFLLPFGRQAVIQKRRKLHRLFVFKALVNPHTKQTTQLTPMYNRRERSVVIISVCTNLPDSENEIISERFYVSFKISTVKLYNFSIYRTNSIKKITQVAPTLPTKKAISNSF